MTAAETDLIIIGAGAAGIGAALAARSGGLDCIVLEARDRVGGRSHTVAIPGGVYDLGCHYLHSGPLNPFALQHFAKQGRTDLAMRSSRFPEVLYLNGVRQSEEDRLACAAFYDDSFEILEQFEGEAVSASLLDTGSPYYPFFKQWFAAIDGVPPERSSVEDHCAYRSAGYDWPVTTGYGATIAGLADGLPITLSTPVLSIDLTGTKVVVETPNGTLRATAIVLTVSTEVLKANAIRITPALPTPIQEAIANLPLGFAERVCLSLDTPVLDGADEIAHAIPTGGEMVELWFNQSNTSTIGGYLAGDLAQDVSREGGAEALIAYTRSAAIEIFGTDLAKRIRHEVSSAWSIDPYALGAYTAAQPGAQAARSAATEPIHERLMLAGEAWHTEQYGTAHGAYATGTTAVTELLRQKVL